MPIMRPKCSTGWFQAFGRQAPSLCPFRGWLQLLASRRREARSLKIRASGGTNAHPRIRCLFGRKLANAA
jgi:hypothetical protein